MTIDHQNEVTDPAGSPRQAAIGTVRIVLAWLLTVVGLPYTWGRCFIGWQLTGRPETWFALALLVVVAAVVALTFRVGATSSKTTVR